MFITSLMFGGMLFPLRLIIVRVFGDNWYGSFGLLSAFTAVMFILAKKNKIGFFGPMYLRFATRLHRGKRKVFVYTLTVFMLIIAASAIWAINEGNSKPYWRDQIIKMLQEQDPEKSLNEKLMGEQKYKIQLDSNNLPTEMEMVAAIEAVTNYAADGWYLHFWTVLFVEEVEVLAVLITTKIMIRKKII
jgi:hypothetical protein